MIIILLQQQKKNYGTRYFQILQLLKPICPFLMIMLTDLTKDKKEEQPKVAAAGMLGKAYLYRKDYAKAGAQFEKFINGH